MARQVKLFLGIITGLALATSLSGCYTSGSSFADQLNPYADSVDQTFGERNTNAISSSGSGKDMEQARHSLEVMGAYRRALTPQPYYPAVRPAEVRLMWVPDHLNRLGDLVPAHYYYLRVLNDRWELQDAFDHERQISENLGQIAPGGTAGVAAPSADYGTGNSGGSATPWVYKEDKK